MKYVLYATILFIVLAVSVAAQECDTNNPQCPNFYTCQEIPEFENTQCQIDCNTICSAWEATDKQRGEQFYTKCFDTEIKTVTCYCSIRGCEKRSIDEGIIEGSILLGEADLDGKINWIGKEEIQPLPIVIPENKVEKPVKTEEVIEQKEANTAPVLTTNTVQKENVLEGKLSIIIGIAVILIIAIFLGLRKTKKKD